MSQTLCTATTRKGRQCWNLVRTDSSGALADGPYCHVHRRPPPSEGAPKTDDPIQQIRIAAEDTFGAALIFQRRKALDRLLALLDGVTGFTRDGDVVLSAEQADATAAALILGREGLIALCYDDEARQCDEALALLASRLPDGKQP